MLRLVCDTAALLFQTGSELDALVPAGQDPQPPPDRARDGAGEKFGREFLPPPGA